jgi:dienelactone hydrolase
MLARLGYTAFAVDVYGHDADGTAIRPTGDAAGAEAGKYYGDTDLLRARIRAAYETAVADPRVDAERIAIIGYCFGGHGALEFARTEPRLKGVGAFHASLAAHDPAEVDHLPPVQLYLGGADPVVPDSAIVAFEDELRTRPDLDWQTSVYSGAPHAFTLPEGPYDARADRRSWNQLVDFLAEVL